ncbi:MAG TPA: MlaD family protein [Amycolatopsis sp.]|nr:MlaD family protein [Amycolatopsis sp.]
MTGPKAVWERVRNVPGLRRDVLFVVVLIAAAIGSTAYILSQYDFHPPWQQRETVGMDLDKAWGVRPESRQEVRIAGVTVGRIDSAGLAPNGNAHLVLSLDPGHPVYSNATAVLRTKSPLNVQYIELNPGGPPAQLMPPGGTIPASRTQRAVEPYELLDKLDDRTRTALTTLLDESDVALADAPQQLPAGLQATDAAVTSFQPVVTQLQTRRDTIAKLVTALSQISTAAGQDDTRLADLASSLQQTLGTLAQHDDKLSATLGQLPGFTQDLSHSMTSVSDLTKQLDPTLNALHAASNDLPSALSRLSQTVDSAGGLIKDAKPVVDKAKPVVADLRPVSGDLHQALTDLSPVADNLPAATQHIVGSADGLPNTLWLDDLAAFVYQTSSSFNLSDVNGGLGRANLTIVPDNPTGGLGPMNDYPGGGN